MSLLEVVTCDGNPMQERGAWLAYWLQDKALAPHSVILGDSLLVRYGQARPVEGSYVGTCPEDDWRIIDCMYACLVLLRDYFGR